MIVLIRAAKVVDPNSKYNNKVVDILVVKGIIQKIGKNGQKTKKIWKKFLKILTSKKSFGSVLGSQISLGPNFFFKKENIKSSHE